MITAGIDAGMSNLKAVIFRDQKLLAAQAVPAGTNSIQETAQMAMDLACVEAQVEFSEIAKVLATGLGQAYVPLARDQSAEATCLARGIYWLHPEAKTVLDVGAQKSLAVRCEEGRPVKIRANARCAAGSGRYLEMAAEVLGFPIDELGAVSFRTDDYVELENTCTVFAESDIITLVHAGAKPEAIIKGAHRALAQRVYTLLLHVDWEEDLCLAGGVAGNVGFLKELEALVGRPLVRPDYFEFTAAIGAALVALTV